MRSTRLVIAVAFASGCTSSSSVTTLDDLYAQLADALCQKEATCGGIGRSETSACVQQVLASVMHAQAYDYRGALAARRIVLNGDQGSACIAALRAASCTNGLIDAFGTDACAHIFTPEVATGGACQNSVECIAGYCSAQTSGCMGACVAFIPTGASCANATGNCATTDFCEPISGLCTARGGAGFSCMGSSYCQSGLHCVGVQPGGMPGKCTERAGVGSACASSYDCAGGLFCNTFTNSPSVCQAVLSPGASCPGPGSCADGQVCGGGVCTAILDVSAACDPAQSACPADAPCDATLHTCTLAPQPAVGDACMPNQGACRGKGLVFGNQLYCSPTNQCASTVDFGQACTPPTGNQENPCYSGSCDATSHVCAVTCM
jgi:hypothetical protein